MPGDFSGTGASVNLHQYTVGLGVASWELDLFGRVRSLGDQALEQYLATEQARRSVQSSLVAQVAVAYLAVAADRERLAYAQETLASQQQLHELVRRRFDAGVSSALDLNQARITLDAARVDVARYTGLTAQDENALALVVGSPVPADLLPEALSENLTALQDLPPGLPVRGAPAPPGHPPGRGPAQGGQRQHRRGAGGALPPDHARLRRRPRQQRAGRASSKAVRPPGGSRRRSRCRSSTAAPTGRT